MSKAKKAVEVSEWLTLQDIEKFLRAEYPTATVVELFLDHQHMQISAKYVKPSVVRGVWGLDGTEQFPRNAESETDEPLAR